MKPVMRFEVFYDKSMSIPKRGHLRHQAGTCSKKKIFLGLMTLMVIGTIAVCQVVYSRDFAEFAMELMPQERSLPGPLKTTKSHPTILHAPKVAVTIKKKKNGIKKNDKGKGITSNVIIEGQENKVNLITTPMKPKINIVKQSVQKRKRKQKKIAKTGLKSGLSSVKNRQKYSVLNNKQKCPDVLRLMSVGKWVKKKITKKEIDYVEKFLANSRRQLHVHPSLSREDGKCGNISLHGLKYTRALCNPKGDKSCCHENQCKALSVEQCQCKNCYDVRQRIHPEHATWTPADTRCKFRNFTASEACSLLSGSQIYLIGDSFIRHLYSAFLMIVKNDGRFGSLKSTLSEEHRRRCEGMYSFGSQKCRPALEPKPGPMCNGTFKLTYISHSKSIWAPQLLQLVNRTLNQEKVILMPGQGVHENCNATKTTQYLEPSIKLLQSKRMKWPKLVWATTHAPGLLKSPQFPGQEFHQVETFNGKMIKYLKPLHIPVLDTFNMTSDAVSFDGTNYGLGVNLAKVQLFLNYLQELRNRHQW